VGRQQESFLTRFCTMAPLIKRPKASTGGLIGTADDVDEASLMGVELATIMAMN
jgi:hypothetical protein